MTKIKIGFDISQINYQGGVSTYTKNLSDELSKIEDLEMVYFYSSLRKSYFGGLSNVKKYKIPATIYEMLFNRWRNIDIEKFIGNIDIFHSSDWTQPPTKAKKVTTYHDVVPLKFPHWSHPKIVDVHKRRLKLVEKEIDKVIAVSEATKKDLIEISNIPEEKIIVIYEGPSSNFKPQPAEKIVKFKNKFGLPEKFILAIGGVGERKNIQRIKEAAKDYNLVITGQTIPWLGIDELELLYSCADALVYCSLYEGFGLPILDAFLAGCPVITSNTSSMPEIGGEAALYVNPMDISDIKKKIKMIMEDRNLKQDMIKKGFTQVKKFSWERCANQTAQVYRSLL